MKITPEDLKASYRGMSDEELLAMDRVELTDMARKCYDGEMERRGLTAKAEPKEAEVEEPEEAAAETEFDEPMVAVQNCGSADHAWAVVSQLEAAGIPARIGGDDVRAANWLRMELGQYPVAVPASHAEAARDFLEAESADAIIVAARYENGMFKPLEEVAILEGTVVEIHVPAAAFGDEAEPRP